MLIKDLMTRDVQTISPDSSVQDAARKMRAFDIGILPVCEDQRCIGVLTDRDITIRATADGLDVGSTRVSEIMTNDVVYCHENDDVSAAAKVMEERQIRRILVCDDAQHILGICSVCDLALDGGNLQLAGEVIHEVARHLW